MEDHVEDHVEEWGPDQQLGGSATSERGAAERREELPLGESTVVCVDTGALQRC